MDLTWYDQINIQYKCTDLIGIHNEFSYTHKNAKAVLPSVSIIDITYCNLFQICFGIVAQSW